MIKMTVQKNLIGLEDLLLGVGTAEQTRGPSGSGTTTISKINGANFPYDATYSMSDKIDALQIQIDTLPEVVDSEGHLLTGLINSSTLDLDLENRLWRKEIDATTAELYYYDQLLFQYDPTNGGLLPFDDSYLAGDAAIQAQIDAFGDVVAYDVGTGPNNIVQLDGDSKLPAVDGSQLINLPYEADTIPTGTVLPYVGTTAPTGFMLCEGAEVSRTTYASLYTLIGDTYGNGDGSTTFNIPDYRGEFLRGNDNGRGIDSGRTLGSYQSDSYASHSHSGSSLTTSTSGAHVHDLTMLNSGGGYIAALTYNSTSASTYTTSNPISSAGNHTHTISGSTGSSGSTETRPRNMSINYIIKVS